MSRHRVFTDELLDAALGAEVVLPPAARGRRMRWFHAGWLEALTRSPAWSPYAVAIPTLAALAAAGPLDPARIVVGALAWTLAEYVLHRFVFHWAPTTEVTKVVTFVLHRHHHRDPDAADRLAATPAQAAGLLVPLSALARSADPSGWTACTFGLVGAWAAYEALHYSHHHGAARGRLLRALRARHLRHHHADPARDYGISSPLWDLVFATCGRRESERGERA